jgi:hypothetical protein
MPQEYRPYWIDKRTEPRLSLCLDGVVSIDDDVEEAVQSRDVSVDGMAILAPWRPPVGAKVVGDFEEIGRICGEVLRWHDDGFSVIFTHDQARATELSRTLDGLEWTRGRRALGERPPPPRPEAAGLSRAARRPAPDLFLEVLLPDDQVLMERLRDVSLTGASVISEARPRIGAQVHVQGIQSEVVRHTDDGFAVRFL